MGPLRLVAQDTWFSARRQGFDSPRGYESDECGFPSRALVLLPERGTRFVFAPIPLRAVPCLPDSSTCWTLVKLPMYVLRMTDCPAILRFFAVAAGVSVLAAACAAGPGPSAGTVVPPQCELRPGAVRGGVFEVHAPGGIQPGHVPVPSTPAERIGFRHLYETLMQVDCLGTRRPGLAGSWVSEENGRAWRFTLREGATFWDGTPVRAEDVLASWRDSPSGWRGGSAEAMLVSVEAELCFECHADAGACSTSRGDGRLGRGRGRTDAPGRSRPPRLRSAGVARRPGARRSFAPTGECVAARNGFLAPSPGCPSPPGRLDRRDRRPVGGLARGLDAGGPAARASLSRPAGA